MNLHFRKLSLIPALALAMVATTVTIQPAEARVYVSGNVSVRFDSGGFPIWGYGSYNRPIYAYDPYGNPIYMVASIYPGCFVPTWGPASYYRGPHFWPHGVCRGAYRPHCAPPPPPHCGPRGSHYRSHYAPHYRSAREHRNHYGRGR